MLVGPSGSVRDVSPLLVQLNGDTVGVHSIAAERGSTHELRTEKISPERSG
jgi:hypothetical protein